MSICVIVVTPDLSEYTFLDRMTDNTFTAHIVADTQSDAFNVYSTVMAVRANATQFLVQLPHKCMRLYRGICAALKGTTIIGQLYKACAGLAMVQVVYLYSALIPP